MEGVGEEGGSGSGRVVGVIFFCGVFGGLEWLVWWMVVVVGRRFDGEGAGAGDGSLWDGVGDVMRGKRDRAAVRARWSIVYDCRY